MSDRMAISEAARLAGLVYLAGSSNMVSLPTKWTADSRDASEGCGFIAVRGARADGHDHIKEAVDHGARCVILEADHFDAHREELESLGVYLIIAKSGERSETAAASLARYHLMHVSPTVIGITGSVGKTTTRTITENVLKKKFRVHAAKKSYNTLIGCSMTLLSMSSDTEIVLLELGTNHPGEIREMVGNFPVDIAIITEISPAHLEGLGSIEGVCSAKMEIASSSKINTIIYNVDNDILRRAVDEIRGSITRRGVGIDRGDIAVGNIVSRVDTIHGPILELTINDHLAMSSPIYGTHNAKNIAFAYAAARELGISDEDIKDAVASSSLPKGRCGITSLRGGLLIDDSYNANPDSVRQAIKDLLSLKLDDGARKIAVLGGMRELGASSVEYHQIMAKVAAHIDEVHLIGDEWRSIDAEGLTMITLWSDREAFSRSYSFAIAEGSAVLVKGSRYYELERLLPLFAEAMGGRSS